MIINNVDSFEPMFGTLRVTPHPILRGTLKSVFFISTQFKPPPQPKIAISLSSA